MLFSLDEWKSRLTPLFYITRHCNFAALCNCVVCKCLTKLQQVATILFTSRVAFATEPVIDKTHS